MRFGDLAALGFLIYLFMSLRRVYGNSRLRTAVKFAMLFFVHSTMLAIGLLAALAFAAFRLSGGA
ncbi:MAG: hypothetical protein AAGF23_17840 [Acidobacteriota bacterium]